MSDILNELLVRRPDAGSPLRDALVPGAPGYNGARRVWNGMIDRRPAIIARCHDLADVRAAVLFAVAEGLPVTVRGGGHNVAGLSLADGALLVDLSPMRAVTVEPRACVATAEGGALLTDLDGATLPYGLACPVGVVSDTGLGGLALGGGYGWLSRKWGLTCDHIESAEVVLSDGAVVTASERANPELLWGLRGGSGSFGAVTRFRLRLRPVRDVGLISAVYPLMDALAALRGYRDFAAAQPDDLQVTGAFKRAPAASWIPSQLHAEPVLALTGVWLGDPAIGEWICDPLFAEVTPAARRSERTPFAQAQAMGDGAEPAGRRYFTKSCYLRDLTGPAAETLLAAAEALPSPYSTIDLGYLLGAIAAVSGAATAFPRRRAPYICTASAAWERADGDAACTAWARGLIDALREHHYGGSYVNYTQVGATSALDVYGPERYARLARLKAEVDPGNVFRGNHNIVPSRTAS